MNLPYTEWRRYLAACARAYLTKWDADDVLSLLNDPRATHGDPGMRMAAALGIDKRRRLEWTAKGGLATPGVSGAVRGAVARLVDEWDGQAWIEGDPHGRLGVRVHGFPTRDEAIEALERLLGRAEYDSLFA